MPSFSTGGKSPRTPKQGEREGAGRMVVTKPIVDLGVIHQEADGGTWMRKLLAALGVVAVLWCLGVPAGIAGPHGCYRSHGCHGPK